MNINLEYTRHVNKYDPIAVAWKHNGTEVELVFDEPITAIYSEKLGCVAVEIYSKGLLDFYSIDGSLISSEKLPDIDHYQFRGINKNLKSKSGISFLFHPVGKSAGNEWGDTEQYELLETPNQRLGKKLDIYR